MIDDNDQKLTDRFSGGLRLTTLVQCVTLAVVLWTGLFTLNKMENQLLIWMEDAEHQRQANHQNVLNLFSGLEQVEYRVTNLEQYNLRKDPHFTVPQKTKWNK